MKDLRIALAWEHVLADVVDLWRQALVELTGRDLLTLPLSTVHYAWFGYTADDVARARVLVESRLSSAPPRPNIVEALARLSRAMDRGECEAYIMASGFPHPRAYKAIRTWLNTWGGKSLPLVCGVETGVRYCAGNLGLHAIIHTRASYPPHGGDPTYSVLVDTPQFDQRAYPESLVADLDAALAAVGFEG